MEYFKNVPKIKYEGPESDRPFAFKYYDGERVVAGKKMKDHLRFAMSWWHTLCAGGSDPFGVETMDRSYGGLTDPMEIARAKADAGFELMTKLGIEFFCFHDVDIAPEGKTFAESKENLFAMVEYIKGKMAETGIKLLWGTANNLALHVLCTAQRLPAMRIPLHIPLPK